MDIELIRIFVDVAEEGSFAAVARKQNTDPSRISRAISSLEKDLGIRLFHRTTRHLALSESGDIYYSQIVSALETLEGAKSAAQAVTALPRGTLRLTASHAYCQVRLVPLVQEFHRLYPDIHLEVHASDAPQSLASGPFDLAIRHAPSVDNDYICTRLHSTRYRLVCSPGFLETIAPPHTPQDLGRMPVVRLRLSQPHDQWMFKKGSSQIEISVSGTLSVSSPLTQLEAVLAGNGLGLLADWLVETDLATGRLVSLMDDFQISATSFDAAAWIIYLDRKYLPLKVRAMIDFLKEKLD